MRVTNGQAGSRTVVRAESVGGVGLLHVAGRLHWPVGPELRKSVAALLERGERTILVDLRNVTGIDAAGVGELVRLHVVTEAAGGELWIDNADAKARRLFERAGLLALLSLDSLFEYERCS